MPRPGPRPYECVRRAWHSDRHQPMRGSIIQQIFRVVNEVHSSVTKKNKEWQEKLPLVVLRAEEIMYSKANSEAEYMNLDTLWDRANDAVNTIIRRDEGSETGELLPPCVEAALNLGCTPVRASRSQRHSNPRSYLTPRAQDPASTPARVLDENADERRPQFSPHHSSNQLNFAKALNVSSVHLVPESYGRIKSTNLTSPLNYPFALENVPAGHNQLATLSTSNPLNSGSVYPLYYGTHHQPQKLQVGHQASKNTHSMTIHVGTPIVTSVVEPIKQNLFSSQGAENVSHRFTQEVMDTQEKPRETECDLSLTLGPALHPCTQRSLASEMEDFGSINSQEWGKLNDFSSLRSKEICFFPTKTAYDRFESTSSMWNSESGRSSEATIRKRKAPFSTNEEDRQFCWQPDVIPNRFTGRTTGPGSVKKHFFRLERCVGGSFDTMSNLLNYERTFFLCSYDVLVYWCFEC
ncbi:uncharacterized protein LOC103953923 isoform X2 [Pyrus x bretschneideri]|uniref:uncharacterized protein LOC103953923 isoform X2 n=1 Tax=Pyrus x bretschneideri TaxID=225117 RepID=UPI002030C75F|nr:uncharacterized protein LOC103953923 isoform X2 [Pyrus x bretschneideri]